MTTDGERPADRLGDEPLALLDAAFAGHREAALDLARHILGDAHLAEDAVQLSFVQILVRLRKGDVNLLRSNPRAVVLKGTRWAALKLAERDRDRHRAASLDERATRVTDAWELVEARMVSEGIVAALPAHYRDALWLRYVEDQPDDRAAARLALTVKAYRRRLDRAVALARVAAARGGASAAVVFGSLFPRRRMLRLRVRAIRLDWRLRQVRARLGYALGSPGVSHWAVIVAVAGMSAGILLAPGASAVATARHETTGIVGSVPPQARGHPAAVSPRQRCAH
jgi:RNA polymerase sigma factor (sigma-70 family)